MESVETKSATADSFVVHPRAVDSDKRPSPVLLGAVLLVVGAIGFSPWLLAKMAREAPPKPVVVDMTSPQNWNVDAKWHHSKLMSNRMNFMTQSRLALNAQRTRNFDRAVKMYTSLLESPANRDGNYVSRGKCYLMLRRFDLALSDFTNAIAIDPHDSDAYMSRAEAYRQLGKTAEAQADTALGMKYNH